eukprot:symbB.v1.2.001301.t2/scaffold57.1/size370615/10
MGNQVPCCGCCSRLRARFYRLEGEVLASDPPEFQNALYWMAHPQHYPRVDECLPKIAYTIQADGSLQQEDFKDSDPQTLEAPADVFYLHGTMEGFGNRASINRYDQETWTGFNTRHQMTACTAFTSACRAFAPLYRQAGMGGSWDVAFQDILKAFEQFLLDTGDRPIVVAGHSQGSIHIIRLVQERIATDDAVMKRLVAVHAPGMGQWIEPSPLTVDSTVKTASAEEPSVALWAAATPQADKKWTLIGFMNGGKGFADFVNPGAWDGAGGLELTGNSFSIYPVLQNIADLKKAINPSLPPIEASKIDIYLQQEASPFCVAKMLQVRMELATELVLDNTRLCENAEKFKKAGYKFELAQVSGSLFVRGTLLPEDDSKMPVLYRNFVESSEVADGLLRVFHHPAMAERMQSLHKGHQDDLHPYDIHLFWGEVRERVRQQVNAFVKAKR